MGITGGQFLRFERATEFRVTGHALERLLEYSGERFLEDEAWFVFSQSRQLSHDDMLMLGYRPRYQDRKAKGIQSWYFQISVEGHEYVAVISEGESLGEYKWVTTYAPNHWNQSNQCWNEIDALCAV